MLNQAIEKFEIINQNSLLIQMDEVDEKVGDSNLIIPEGARSRAQTAVGSAVIMKKCEHEYVDDERYAKINVGDRIIFPAGTPIGAYLENDPDVMKMDIPVSKLRLIQIIHIDNVIAIRR